MRELFDRHLGEDWLRRSDPRPGSPSPGSRTRSSGPRGAPRANSSSSTSDQERAGPAAARRGSRLCQALAETLRPGHADPRLRPAHRDLQAAPLLTHDPERVRRSFAGGPPVQLLIAGKAHPSDEKAKRRSSRLRPAQTIAWRRGSRSSRTTTSLSPRRSSAAAMSGSTCHGRRWRRRDERHEVGRERRPPPQRPRRLVGRGIRRRLNGWAIESNGSLARRGSGAGRPPRQRSTTCSRAR